ncbi:MAG: Hsp70 family protein, partial [Ignavibacteria bacterium]
KDKATGKEQSIKITASTGLSKEEIEKMKRDAQEHAAEDKRRKEEAELKNQADNLIFTTEKQLKEYGDKLSPDMKTKIQTALDQLKEAHKSGIISDIKAKMDALNSVWNEAATQMYQSAGSSTTGSQNYSGSSSTQSEKKDKDVEDASYEVIDDDKK